MVFAVSMVSLPPFGMASRALTARIRIGTSSCVGIDQHAPQAAGHAYCQEHAPARPRGQFPKQRDLPLAGHPLRIVGVGADDPAGRAVLGRDQVVSRPEQLTSGQCSARPSTVGVPNGFAGVNFELLPINIVVDPRRSSYASPVAEGGAYPFAVHVPRRSPDHRWCIHRVPCQLRFQRLCRLSMPPPRGGIFVCGRSVPFSSP
jgi:hypothetical protein